MIELIIALQKVLDMSAKKDIQEWLAPLPKGGAWHLISDYTFGNPDRHDTAAFVLLLHHDRLDTILGYIDNQAPTDIKNSRTASEGLIRYLQSPVTFNFTFVLDEGDRFLATYATVSEMIDGLEYVKTIAASMDANTGRVNTQYFTPVQERLSKFIDDLRRKGNAKLARQVFLVAAYAAVVLDYLDMSADPKMTSWVSDRDAILDQHDGIVWDIATIMFYLLKGKRKHVANGGILIDSPKLLHITPDKDGENYLDPLIRMADYLAGAASDLNLNTFDFSHPKLYAIGSACFCEAKNSVLCTISWTGVGFLVRRLKGELRPGADA